MLRATGNTLCILIFSTLFCNTAIAKESIVFGNIANGKPVFINIDSGKTTAPIPAEYKIVPQSHYFPLSDTILLQRDSDLYAFFSGSSTIVLLKSDFASAGSEIYAIQSISDSSKYIIYSYSENEGQFGESFFLNCTDNSIRKTQDSINMLAADQSKQIIYDSKRNALYTWNAGEGISIPLPIERIELTTNDVKMVVTEDLFSDDPLFNIDYYADFIIGTPKNYAMTKEIFIYSIGKGTLKIMQAKNKDLGYCYSGIYRDETNHLYLGTKDDIKMLKLEDSGFVEVADYKDSKIYPNSMYLIDNRLIYQAEDGIVILNSHDLTKFKRFPLPGINKMNFPTEFGIYSLK